MNQVATIMQLKKIIFLTLFVLINSTELLGQFASHFNTNSNWEANRREIFLAVGATQFMGDLGGRDRIGTQKSIIDWDWAAVRMGAGLGYRYRFKPKWATTTKLYFGYVSGDDAHTNEIIRNSRNLSFRSPLLELSQRIEFNIYTHERIGARYSIPGLKGMKSKAEFIYIYTGIGGFFFNPQMNIEGRWTNLHPLRTEGQGLPDGPDEYKRISISIPFGIGFKVSIGQFWRIGLEMDYHLTFTDYLDDVSTDYYNPQVLASNFGNDAGYASNPAKQNHSWFAPGQQRGNPDDNDAFFYANIVFTRNISYSKPKSFSGFRWKRSRTQ